MQGSTNNHSTTLYGVLHEIEDAMTAIQIFKYEMHNFSGVPIDVSYDVARSTIETLDDSLCRIRDDLRCIVGESFAQASR